MRAPQPDSADRNFAGNSKALAPRPLTLAPLFAMSLIACQGVIDPAGSGGASSGGGAANAGTAGTNPSGQPARPSAAPLRRLSTREYHNTVRDLFAGIPIPDQPFPPPVEVDGFENGHLSLPPTSLLGENEYAAADAIATLVVAQRARWVSCTAPDAACLRATTEQLIPRVYRRPPKSAERERMLAFSQQSFAAGGFEVALHDVVQALLLTPQFLFRAELGASPDGAGSNLVQLSSHELASRLSYFLWQTMPDSALFEAAAAGTLSEPETLLAHARRL
ncbi:MAG TPA: DUF1592 domain-containing protein, partial [Polyangiaceae bacterium]|nr:DUF1592 domain-containing protein [Polyangiaceae bacterium]